MGSLDGMRIAIDPGNGVGSIIIDELFQKFGVETTCINNEPDGRFPNRPSEPAPKNLGDLISMSKKEGFDFSGAYDGDADRCVFLDDQANPVSPEKIGIIVAKSLITPESNKVLAGVPCSMILEDEIPKIGGELIWIRVGDVFVCEELKKHNAALAMESLIAASPYDLLAHIRLAELYQDRLDRPKRARELYQRALELDAQSYLDSAKCLSGLERHQIEQRLKAGGESLSSD